MKKFRFLSILIVAISILSVLSFTKTNQLKRGVIKGRTAAIIRVWEEKADNTRGREIVPESWIQKDQTIEVQTERERIIYDYKFGSNDTWKTDNHAWCQTNSVTVIP